MFPSELNGLEPVVVLSDLFVVGWIDDCVILHVGVTLVNVDVNLMVQHLLKSC